jgi:hypothetical protein
VFLFPQSDDISRGLPQGIGFGEWEIYILAKGYFLTKDNLRMYLRYYGNMKFFAEYNLLYKRWRKVHGKYEFDFDAY